MKCKICQQNETDNTSGICWKCIGSYNKPPIEPPMDMGEGLTNYFRFLPYAELPEGTIRGRGFDNREILINGEWKKY